MNYFLRVYLTDSKVSPMSEWTDLIGWLASREKFRYAMVCDFLRVIDDYVLNIMSFTY